MNIIRLEMEQWLADYEKRLIEYENLGDYRAAGVCRSSINNIKRWLLILDSE